MPPHGVIFDLDGVIVYSSAFHFGACQRWARKIGIIEEVDEAWPVSYTHLPSHETLL